MEFPKILEQLRVSRGHTQSSLARVIGVSRSAVSMWERGNRDPDPKMLEILADYFNVDMDYLRGRSKIMRKNDLIKQYEKGLADATKKRGSSKDNSDDDWTEEELRRIDEFKKLLIAARPKN